MAELSSSAELAARGGADTIVGIATAPGRGGIGILRLSGPGAGLIAAILTRTPLDRLTRRPRQACRVSLFDDQGQPIDEGLVLFFPAPHSFTGDDVVELQGHGSPQALALLESAAVAAGARRARPGEFTERAFVAGKLDLVQAEAVADLIEAGSQAAARAARRSLAGVFSGRIAQLLDDLIGIRAELEASFDFVDEDVDLAGHDELLMRLDAFGRDLDHLLDAARHGRRLRRGAHVVIAGAPNAGKSSLFNALADDDVAIVTPIAGTTRDLNHEEIECGGIAITLVDTAGLRESDDPIETEGIRRSRHEINRADLVLEVVAADAGVTETLPLSSDDPNGTTEAPPVWRVLNKIDLVNAQGPGKLPPHDHAICALDGTGIADLRAAIGRLVGAQGPEADSFSARSRHLDALGDARRSTVQAREELAGAQVDLAAAALFDVQQALSRITGAYCPDDLLGAIFSRFCIGK